MPTKQYALIAREGHGMLTLVAVSVGTRGDLPERLRVFGVGLGADFSRWKLLTGSRDEVCRFATALRIGDREGPPCDGLEALMNEGRLILVDTDGRSRGMYRSDARGVDEVFHRARRVAQVAAGVP